MKDSSVLEVFDLHVGVQSHLHVEALAGVGGHFQFLMHFEVALMGVDVEGLFACQTQRICALSWKELQGEDSQSGQIAPMNSLERLSND